MISETIELLGKGLYKSIPDVLTLTSIPTASELDYVGSEDFDKTMLDTILPTAVKEKINFNELLEIDYYWICRCLRILNYGPYMNTSTIFCGECGTTSRGDYQVDFNTVGVKTLPEGFVNDIVITRDDFIDFDGDIHLVLPTIQKMLNSGKDKAFQNAAGRTNTELARICYMVTSMGTRSGLTPIEIKLMIQNKMSAADYTILRDRVNELTDYGLRAGGKCRCPKCGNTEAAFLALVDDRFFRPSLGNLRQWKHDRNSGTAKDVPGSKTETV